MSVINIILLIHLFCERTLGQIALRELSESVPRWNYDPTNPKTNCKPDSWSAEFPDCGGKRQSPIDIKTSDAKSDPNLEAVQFDLYNSRPTGNIWTVINTGNGVQVTTANWPNARPGISRGGLTNSYQFLQFHLHWGSAKAVGSEHTLNGSTFPLEIHLVHEKIPKSSSTAVDGTGLAVVGVLVNSTTESSARSNSVLQEVISAMAKISNAGDNATLSSSNLVLASLLPDSTAFYRYLGSLTTPPCTESVVWTVMEAPIVIPEAQMTALRNALPVVNISGSMQPLKDNHRPTQMINGRIVTYYTQPVTTIATAPTSTPSPKAAGSGASGTGTAECILPVMLGYFGYESYF